MKVILKRKRDIWARKRTGWSKLVKGVRTNYPEAWVTNLHNRELIIFSEAEARKRIQEMMKKDSKISRHIYITEPIRN